ncbi:MAG: cyclic nucleotide-binding domain-containing protein [Pseudomonadota bacterium]|nr:cyclic nucleotide-binding domain-containing protein [Pseudomonadota bacterium]
MGTIADELAIIPFLRRAPDAQLRASAPLWEQYSLAPGEVFWDIGGPVDALAVVVLGELVAEVDGTEVGRVLPGELLGEASAFFAGATRSATLRARTAAQVLTLPVASLHTLRWQGSGVYDALLEQGLLTLVRRVGATNVRIAQVATGGVAAPARTEPSALVRFWKALRPGGPSGPCPPIEPLLRRQPGLADVDGEVIAALARGFQAEPVEEGKILFLEGEQGAAAWLVADGGVDVLRNVRGDRAELLANLGPGSLFGINTLIERGPRTASCVAARPGWLYKMDADGYASLRGPNRLVWRESLLGSLATQIRNANTALQRASGGKPVRAAAPRPAARTTADDDGRFQELLRASGWLEGLPDIDLEKMEVVIDEDQRRNPKRK